VSAQVRARTIVETFPWTASAVRRLSFRAAVRFGRRLTANLELVRTRGIRLSNSRAIRSEDSVRRGV
jgi:hypothetical protein